MGSRRLGAGLRLAGVSWFVVVGVCVPTCSSLRRGGVSPNPQVIGIQEIQQYRNSGTADVFELIQRARPRWLQTRGERSLNLETVILVYLNQQKIGELDVLHGLKLDNIAEIRRLDASRAGLLPGGRDDHVEAAIVIETIGHDSMQP